ncbi:hypothetical protein RB2654_14055 [Rhodobacterales bacterium HTCC2654]|uniref:Uncharacterized protein n=1 Tax=Maritimibacter alkaliphilus HTCC2654 TaxID=314271 RepID=A3VGL0_9RHOB|nr:hypothetical protein RB2654_14055 [Rhodobacterales bacterium HTCC2654] [Maritimibacter alkaliphilus HTCC2654]
MGLFWGAGWTTYWSVGPDQTRFRREMVTIPSWMGPGWTF